MINCETKINRYAVIKNILDAYMIIEIIEVPKIIHSNNKFKVYYRYIHHMNGTKEYLNDIPHHMSYISLSKLIFYQSDSFVKCVEYIILLIETIKYDL